jgi:hypothetical protein
MVALLPKPRARKILSFIEHENEKGCLPACLKNKSAVCRATSSGCHFAPRVTIISL